MNGNGTHFAKKNKFYVLQKLVNRAENLFFKYIGFDSFSLRHQYNNFE